MHQLPLFQEIELMGRKEMLRHGRVPDEFKGVAIVYLLCFSKPIGSHKKHGSARHYLGIVRNGTHAHLKRRIKQHINGNYKNCSKITAAARKQKAKIRLSMIWVGVNNEFEHYLKSWKSHKDFCPLCHDVPFF